MFLQSQTTYGSILSKGIGHKLLFTIALLLLAFVQLFGQSLAHLDSLSKNGEWTELVTSSIKLSDTALDQDEIELADSIYTITQQYLLEGEGKAMESLGLLYHKWGVMYYRLDQFETGIEKFDKAIDARRSVLEASHPDIGRSILNTGVSYKYLQDYNRSESRLLESLQHFKGPDQTGLLAFAYRELGEVNEYMGDYQQALNFYDLSREIYVKDYGQIDYDVAMLNFLIGGIYSRLNDPAEAENKLTSALQTFTVLQDADGQAVSNNALGNLEVELNKNYSNALDYYFESLGLYEKLDDSERIAAAHNNIGVTYKRLKKFDLARAHLDSSLQIRNSIFSSGNSAISESWDNLGSLLEEQGLYDEATKAYNNGLQNLLPDYSTENEFESPSASNIEYSSTKPLLLTLLSDKAKCLLEWGQISSDVNKLKAAFHHSEIGDLLIDQMRRDYRAEGSKLFWVENTRPFYERAIEICLKIFAVSKDQSYMKKAYAFAEKSKAILLLEGIQEMEARGLANLPTEVLDKEKAFKSRIIRLQDSLFLSAGSTEIKESLIDLNEQYSTFIRQLELDYPVYYQRKYGAGPAKISEIQSLLSDESLIIQFFSGTEKLYIFSFTNSSFLTQEYYVQEVPLDSIKTFLSYVSSKELLDQNPVKAYREFTQTGYAVFNTLLAPILDLKNIKRLILIPDGIFSSVPFEALPTRLTNSTDPYYGNLELLIKDYSISYSYSGSLLLENIRRADGLGSSKKLLALAPSYENSNDLLPLTGSVEEIKSISQLYPNRLVLTENDAAKDSYLSNAANYDIIHLAMHGIIDQNNHTRSYLAFTYDEEAKDASNLYAYEIPSTELTSKLVVLSACETGVGKEIEGEGILSLARNFMYAGVPSVVMSLWQSNDRATQQIMNDFHKNLSEGKDKDEALRLAKLNYLDEPADELAHPFYWAPFVSVGDYHSLARKNPIKQLIPLLLLSLTLLVVFYIWNRRQ